LAGRPEPPARTVASAPPVSAPSPDRLREYQNRLRVMEARVTQDAHPTISAPAGPPSAPTTASPRTSAQDPLVAERRRREYESLFASNVVLSRRPEPERPDSHRQNVTAPALTSPTYG